MNATRQKPDPHHNVRHPRAWPTRLLLACLPAMFLGIAATACQTIEATGERHFSFIGEQQEIEMGETSNEDIVRAMGLYKDESLQRYVQALGANIAKTTERPELPWTFQVVDDDAVNAFALPGGYVYLTRGIMSHFNNEAQLVGVLGHEIAHVTAKHSVIRVSNALLAQLGLGVATIAVPELQGFSSMLGQGMQLLFLKFSRDDESEADLLSIRYMLNVDEDPRELMEVMNMLASISARNSKGGIPEWASTHPFPENRREVIEAQLAELGPHEFQPVEREAYLRRLEGMAYGDDPREGIIRGNAFYHPGLAFQLAFPEGWKIANRRSAVVGIHPREDAAFQLTLGPERAPGEALQAFFQQNGVRGLSSSSYSLHGFPAAEGGFLARTEGGLVRGRATFISYQGNLFQLFGYSPDRVWQERRGDIEYISESFGRLTDERFVNAQPMRLRIVKPESRVSLRALHDRHDVPIPLDELARLNQVGPEEIFEAGMAVKVVIGESP